MKTYYSDKSYYSIVQNGKTFVILRANTSSALHYNEQRQLELSSKDGWSAAAMIAKHEAQQIPFQHLLREEVRRQTIIAKEAEEAALEREAVREKREALIREAFERNYNLTFAERIQYPDREQFYGEEVREEGKWYSSRPFDQDGYDAAVEAYRQNETLIANQVAEYFSNLNDGDTILTATEALQWSHELFSRGMYLSFADDNHNEYLILQSYKYDEDAEGVYIEAVAIDRDTLAFKSLDSVDPATLLTVHIPNRNYRLNRYDCTNSHYEGLRVRIEIAHKLHDRLEIDVTMKYERTDERGKNKPVAEISTSGTYRSIERTAAYVELINVAVGIGQAWNEREIITIES